MFAVIYFWRLEALAPVVTMIEMSCSAPTLNKATTEYSSRYCHALRRAHRNFHSAFGIFFFFAFCWTRPRIIVESTAYTQVNKPAIRLWIWGVFYLLHNDRLSHFRSFFINIRHGHIGRDSVFESIAFTAAARRWANVFSDWKPNN